MEDIQQIELGKLAVTKEFLGNYLDAVDNHSSIHDKGKHIPPIALAAWALGIILDRLSLPPGAVHTVQEISALRGILLGQELCGNARCSRPITRRGWRFITADFVITTIDQNEVLKGKTMVMVPENG